MTRKQLSQIFYLEKEQKMWEEKLRELEAASLIKGQEITGMPFANTNETSDKVMSLVIRKQTIATIIEEIQERIDKQKEEIYEYINTVDDSLLRQIVVYRCVSCMNWVQVANRIGGGNTAESVRKIYERSIPKS